MPPSRPSPPTPGNARRRPGPMMPSGWVWLVILGMILAMIWIWYDANSFTTITYTDLIALVDKKLVSKATFVGKDHLTGELKPEALDDETVKTLKMRGSKFSVNRPPPEERAGLEERLRKARAKPNYEEERA